MTRTRAMTADPIVEEVRDVKRRLAARFNFDAAKMLRDAQKRQTDAAAEVVTPSRRKSTAEPSRSPRRVGRGG